MAWRPLLALSVLVGMGSGQPSAEPARSAFRIVAYLPDYRVAEVDEAVGSALTDLIYFSLDPTPSGEVDGRRLPRETLAKLHRVRSRYGTRLLVAVGGWGRSRAFGPMAKAGVTRRRFAQALTRFCLDNRLDGADLDWEHPTNPAEEAAYGDLLAALKGAFRPHGLRLTVAVASWQRLGADGLGAVDRIHLMAYDHDGRHATAAQARKDVQALVKQGAARQKICLGIPFYGRGIRAPGQALAYGEIVRRHEFGPEVDEIGGVYFNGIRTVEAKTRYAMGQRLGGVMIWEIGQDAPGPRSLLQVIRRTVSD
jgi:GH18 family chitinase